VPGADDYTCLLNAGLLIFAAMVFDLLDGTAARWTRQTSPFGAQLDSLCDAISFGVAPAFILLSVATVYPPRVLWVIAALFMVCAVLRLARFNVETKEEDAHDSFSGLPSPAAAGTVASFAVVAPSASTLMLPEAARHLLPGETTVIAAIHNALPIVALILAGLMVSRIRYPHLVHQALRKRRRFQYLVQIVFAVAAVIAFKELAAPLILCAFVAGAPLRAAWQRVTRPRPLPMEAAPANGPWPLDGGDADEVEHPEPEAEPRRPRWRWRWPLKLRGRRRRG
jgi:CDP-diacylglycerol--serine O-phosphatidyltransferase